MLRRAAVIFSVLLGASGCASNPAQSSAVPLQIPEPPPRTAMAPIPAAETPPPDRPAPPPVPVPAPAPTSAPVPPPRAAAPPAAPSAAPAEPAQPTPAPELRPAASAGRIPTAAQVMESFSRTKQKLDAINPRRLNAGKRADYDSARRFLAQTEAAVKENNLMLAQSSAEKAETLADGLR
jgi:hypothetical protein